MVCFIDNFLENPGLSFSPSRIPFYPTPRGYYPSLIMSRQSSMFSQTPETFLFSGPSVPLGYQSLSATFSGASPRPIEQVLSSGSNGTQVLNAEQILMMYGSIPNPQPQGVSIRLGGNLKVVSYLLGGNPKVVSYLLKGFLKFINLQDSTYPKVNLRLSTYPKVNPSFSTYLKFNPSFSACLKDINPKVSTQLKVSNRLLVNHFFKELEMDHLIIIPMFNQVMVLHMHNLL